MGAALGDRGFGGTGETLEMLHRPRRVALFAQGDEAGQELRLGDLLAAGLGVAGGDGVGAGNVALAQATAGHLVALGPELGDAVKRSTEFGAVADGLPQSGGRLVAVGAAQEAGLFQHQAGIGALIHRHIVEQRLGVWGVALEGEAGLGAGAVGRVEPGDLAGGARDIGVGQPVEPPCLNVAGQHRGPAWLHAGNGAIIGCDPGGLRHGVGIRSLAKPRQQIGAAQHGADKAGGATAAAGGDILLGFGGQRLLASAGEGALQWPVRVLRLEAGDLVRCGLVWGNQAVIGDDLADHRIEIGFGRVLRV